MDGLSELGRLSVVLLAAGVFGVLLLQLYLRACVWADWGLLSSRVRRRVHTVQRRAPVLAAGSGMLAVFGCLLGVLEGLT